MSTEAILAAATHHAELAFAHQSILDKDAPAELERLHPLIADLEKDINASKQELRNLAARNKMNMQGQSPLRESTGRRLAYTMTGKKRAFERRVRKEEENISKALIEELEYVVVHFLHRSISLVIGLDHSAKERVDCQEMLLAESYASRTRLEQESQQLKALTTQLDELYDLIFAGSTTEHPEEDAYEHQVSLALATFTDLDARHCAEEGALQHLEAAEAKMTSLCSHYRQSLPLFSAEYSKNSYYKKQIVLEKAGRILGEAQNSVIQAKFIQPDIHLIPPIPVKVTGNMYNSVAQASQMAATALKELKNQIVAEKNWIKSLQSGVEQAEKELQEARDDLRRIRKSIFERIVSQGSNPPPEYEE